jgi:hypothetical protein
MQTKENQLKKYRFALVTKVDPSVVEGVTAKPLSGSMIIGRPPNNNIDRTHTHKAINHTGSHIVGSATHRVSLSRLQHYLDIKTYLSRKEAKEEPQCPHTIYPRI